jgi:hypothetical protein
MWLCGSHYAGWRGVHGASLASVLQAAAAAGETPCGLWRQHSLHLQKQQQAPCACVTSDSWTVLPPCVLLVAVCRASSR